MTTKNATLTDAAAVALAAAEGAEAEMRRAHGDAVEALIRAQARIVTDPKMTTAELTEAEDNERAARLRLEAARLRAVQAKEALGRAEVTDLVNEARDGLLTEEQAKELEDRTVELLLPILRDFQSALEERAAAYHDARTTLQRLGRRQDAYVGGPDRAPEYAAVGRDCIELGGVRYFGYAHTGMTTLWAAALGRLRAEGRAV